MRRAWKSRVIRAAAKLLAVTVTATSCLSGMAFTARAEGYGKNGIVRDMTSQQLVEDMGLGYNIGNTFDSIGSFITETDPWEYQKAWGNDPVSQLFIQKVRESGFKTVRLPVSWAHWIDANNQINPGYLQAVQTVVDWCMDEDMYVILNVHHDSGAADTSWIRNAATDWDGTTVKYAAVWTQISNHFKNYGDHLIFEGMNEVEFPAAPTMARQYEILNGMNQLFVDTVRATGGNNAARHLLIPGYNTNIERSCARRYQMPADPANHCILSIHYYSPPAFCVAEHNVDWAVPVTTWGTEEDLKRVEADFDLLAEHYLSKGVPVIIGEYGVLTEDQKDPESIRAYVSKVPEIIMQYGMCPVLWDTSNAGDMKFIERTTGEFYDPQIKANYQALAQRKALGQIQKKEFHFQVYQRVSLPIRPGGWVSLDAYEPEKILGVAFELDCAGDWDSYGGGGLYLDGWDNMPQWNFGSVYDEVVYMFSAEERARIKDQLGVFIFWMDESKGGNRREELSVKGGQITLLYGENELVNAPRQLTGTVSGKSSGGFGGGGGSSRYPNNSTEPVGDETNNEKTNLYYSLHEGKEVVKEGVLKKGRNSKTSEEDTETGAYKIKIKDFCPDYAVGDKVRVNVSYLSDEGSPSIALVTTENGYTSSDDNGIRNKNTLVWDCVPPDGEVTLNLWYLGNNKYFMYRVSCEILEKVPGFAVEDINNNDSFGEPERTEDTDDKGNPIITMTYPFSLAELARVSDVELGEDCRIKLTVYPVAKPQEGDEYSVYFEDVNGAKVTGNLEGSSVTLIGTPKDDTVYFAFTTKNGAAAQSTKGAFPPVSFSNFVLKQLPAIDILAEIVSSGRVEISSTKANPRPIEETDKAENGVKVYFEYEGNNVKEEDLGGALVVNGNWDYTNDKWVVRTDENGEYIWCAGSAQSTVILSLWSIKSSFRITSVVGVKKAEKAPALAENEELMTEGEDGKYHVPEGKRLAAIRFKTSGGGNAYGAMLMMNADPWETWIDFCDGEETVYKFETKPLFTELELQDKFVDYMIFVYSDETEEPTPAEKFEEFAVTKDKPVEYSCKELLEKNEIAAGSRVKLTITVKTEGAVGGEVSFNEENGMKVSGTITSDAAGTSTAIVLGSSKDNMLALKVNDDSATDAYTVTDIRVEKAEGAVLAELQKAGRIEFDLSQVETKEMEGLANPGLKVYYEFDGDVKGVSSQLAVNGDWGNAGNNSNWTIGTDDNGSYIWYGCEKVDSVLFACWYIDKPLKITKLVHEKAKKGAEEPVEPDKPKPEEPVLKDGEILVEAGEDGKYYVPEGKGVPKAIRFKASEGTNEWGANLQINCDPWSLWIGFTAGEETVYTFEQEYSFTEIKLDAKTIDYMIFVYSDEAEEPVEPDKPKPEEPVLKDGEILVEAGEDGKYYVPEGKGVPKAIRFKASEGTNEWGANLQINCDPWSLWIGFTAGEEKIYTFEQEYSFTEIKLDAKTIDYMIFVYDDTTTTSLMRTIANSILYRMPDRVLAQNEEIFELEAFADGNGIYYLPEDMNAETVGIRAEVASDSKEVTVIFDEDSDNQVKVKPENKTIYYFFNENTDAESIQFKGQNVKNVTLLYWNGEEGEAANEDGVFNLPDYRIPAAVQFTVSSGEDKAAKAVLSVDIYDAKAKQWKEEGKVLTKELSVEADSTGWYVFTDKNLEILEDAFAAAKEGYMAPRLGFAVDGVDYRVENIKVYYNTAYTDEMEIVEPEEVKEKVQDSDKETKPAKKVVEKAQKTEEEKPVEEVQKPAEETKESGEEMKKPAEKTEDEDESKVPSEDDTVKDEEEKDSSKDSETTVKDEDKDEEEDSDHETQNNSGHAEDDHEKQDGGDDKRESEDADSHDNQITETENMQTEVKDDTPKADDTQAADSDGQKAGGKAEDCE